MTAGTSTSLSRSIHPITFVVISSWDDHILIYYEKNGVDLFQGFKRSH